MATTSISLLERLRTPNEQRAWRRFAQLYTPLILAWVRAAGVRGADAEDVAQDVLTVLVKKMPNFQYDPGKSFRAWLRTITVNRCRDYQRRSGRSPNVTQDGGLDVESPDDNNAFAETEYRRHLVSRALDLMQTEFEETTWKACWESVVNDRLAADVARELGITTNAVYVAKSRVLRRLRTELDGLLD